MSKKKIATIIIPHHDRHDLLCKLLSTLDNSIFDICIHSGHSFGVNCNMGAETSRTDKLIFLNDDAYPTTDDLKLICDTLTYADIVGSTQITKNKSKYYGIGFECNKNSFYFNDYKPFYYPQIQLKAGRSLFPSGFLIAFTKDSWKELNGFNEDFNTGYEDVDLGIRAIKLKMDICILNLEILHLESESSGRFKYNKENWELLGKLYNQNYLKQLYENTNYCI